MNSIRSYLVIVILSVICLSNFIAALQGYTDSLATADRLVDEQILEKYDAIVALIDNKNKLPEQLWNENTFFQIWDSQKLIAKSENAPSKQFITPNNHFHTISYQGRRWRAYSDAAAADFSIIVASRFDAYSALTEGVLLKAIMPIVWVMPILGLLVLLVINVGLRPLKRLANQLAARDANDFSSFPQESYVGELKPIVKSLNNLFQRLSEVFDREKRFSADAAHELRTPLAALKINIHNLSKDMGDSHDLDVLKRTASRMENCIEQLLSMHRETLEVGEEDLEACDLGNIAKETIADMYDVLSTKKQIIELLGSETYVLAKASSLAVLIRNLIDNASKYAPIEGVILVTTSEKNGIASILVEDSGPGIHEGEYVRVLDRFYRVGGDRHSSSVVGSGLGLSIVSFIAQLYNAQIRFSRSSGLGGLAVEISFPVSHG